MELLNPSQDNQDGIGLATNLVLMFSVLVQVVRLKDRKSLADQNLYLATVLQDLNPGIRHRTGLVTFLDKTSLVRALVVRLEDQEFPADRNRYLATERQASNRVNLDGTGLVTSPAQLFQDRMV